MAEHLSAKHLDGLRLVGTSNSNKLMGAELVRLAWAALGLRPDAPKKQGTGALVYSFDASLARLAVLYHRTSARVLWDVYELSARRLEPLYAQLRELIGLEKRSLFWTGARISVEAYGVQGFAAGERQIVGTVKNALVEGFAEHGIHLVVEPQSPDFLISVRMPGEDEKLVISLDLAGRPMHRRGYRSLPGEAPLREDLAAQLVMQTRHDPRTEVLLDPMAGSGTLAIEAAGLARATPVWSQERRPSAAAYPLFGEAFAARPEPLFDVEPVILANEAEPETYNALRANVDAAAEAGRIRPRRGDFREIDPASLLLLAQDHGKDPSSGVIVVNPPFGHRMQPDSDQLIEDLARWCRGFPGWRVGVVAPGSDVERAFGRPKVKKPVKSGPLKASFFVFQM